MSPSAREQFGDLIDIKACPYIQADWVPQCRFCKGCGKALKGRQTVWCSKDCGDAFWDNHRFQYSRSAVLREAKKRAGLPEYRWTKEVPCGKCFDITSEPEVNHIIPLNGESRTGLSCSHHQENLEVLCHDDHVRVTAQQREAGILK